MHFFIDHTELSTLQSDEDGFGPDTTDPSNVYNATARFQLTNSAKAFACESGLMVVQQSVVDDGLVNLIVKPNANANALADVQYYVYRGVLKASLITAAGALQHTGADNELLTRIWADPPTDTDAGTLGYDSNTILGSELLESIFDCSRADIEPIFVKEGEWIGSFSTAVKIGFEVVLDGRFSADLEYARAERHQVVATGLADMALRIKREEILDFIDPAAFFGLHIDQKVGYSTYSPAKTVNKTSATAGNAAFLYTLLLTNFSTKNRVYLDIRSEKGYSYNFYQNYAEAGTGNNIDVASQAAAGVPQVFASNDWPIFYAAANQITTSTSNNLKIKLRIDDNTKPILFIKNSFFKAKNKNLSYIKEDEITKNGNATLTDWSKRIQFDFRNTGAGAARPNIANYIKLNYFRQVHNAAAPGSVLSNPHYYDSAFCSIDLPRLGDATAAFKQAKSAEPIYVREPNNADGTGNFGLNMANGAYWDTGRVLFYAMLQNKNSAQRSEKVFVNTYSQKLDLVNAEYKASPIYTNTEILCRSYVTNAGTLRIPSINHFAGEDVGTNTVCKESVMLLGLSMAEIASIKADAQLDRLHHRFIHLEPLATNPQADTTGHRYFSYTVQLQGMLGDAAPTLVTPQHAGNPIVVQSRDNQFFSSALFSAAETVTAGLNRIEFHVIQGGFVKITDNRDLALVHDVERIYYVYFSSTNVVTQVCDLGVVMADTMKRVRNGNLITWPAIPPIPAGYNLTVDYAAQGVPGVDAAQSYANADGDVFTRGTGGAMKYVNQSKKNFMVHFEEALVENAALAIDFTYVHTLRLYANPSLAAATIGALVELTHPIVCQGLAYADGTCYPSAEHVDGLALDTNYNWTLDNDVAFIVALNRFGFKRHLVGNSPPYLLTLHNDPRVLNTIIDAPLHNSHLHSTRVVLNDCNRAL